MKKHLLGNCTIRNSTLRSSTLSALVCVFLVTTAPLLGQGAAGTGAKFEPRTVIDIPTAGMLAHGHYGIDVEYYRDGGVTASFAVGAFDRVLLGISYGGTHLVGTDSPSWNQVPGYQLRFRIFEESIALPAFTLGFDSQGDDTYIDSLDRYTVKSPGLYLVASKNYAVAGFLSVHGGFNYSLERADDDADLNAFLGAEKTLGKLVSFVAEYNFGLNDGIRSSAGTDAGFMNMGVRASLGEGFTFTLNFKDVLQNDKLVPLGANRTLGIEYARSF